MNKIDERSVKYLIDDLRSEARIMRSSYNSNTVSLGHLMDDAADTIEGAIAKLAVK